MVRQGKNRKDRLIPTGERAVAWGARYLKDARPRLVTEPDDGTLFLTVEGGPFTVEHMTALIGGYVRRSGVGKPGACHLFRHTMATLMLEGGADIRYIQQMLGHADISSTQIYTQVSLRALQAIHAATHPAASNQPRRARAAGDAGEDGGQDAQTQDDTATTADVNAGIDLAEALHDTLHAEAHDEQDDLADHARQPSP